MDNKQLSSKCVDRVLEVFKGDPLTMDFMAKLEESKIHGLRQVLGTAIQGVLDGKL